MPKHEPEVMKAKRGAPTTYRREYAEQAKHLCRLGAVDQDLAHALHTNLTTIKKWRAVHREFAAAIKVGKQEANDRMEHSLYHRGVGYSYDAVKIFMPAGAKKPIYAPYVEHMPPDPTSMIFWLKNRDPARWRDAWQVEHSLGKYIISDKPMTVEQWTKERATLIDVTPEDAPPALPEDNDDVKK